MGDHYCNLYPWLSHRINPTEMRILTFLPETDFFYYSAGKKKEKKPKHHSSLHLKKIFKAKKLVTIDLLNVSVIT